MAMSAEDREYRIRILQDDVAENIGRLRAGRGSVESMQISRRNLAKAQAELASLGAADRKNPHLR